MMNIFPFREKNENQRLQLVMDPKPYWYKVCILKLHARV